MAQSKVLDCVIIGAGVVGASVFNALTKSGYNSLLIDKACDVATGASKANSGLVHAGFDAPVGTLKAKLNVEGNKMFPGICKRLGLPLKKVGALVVGNDTQVVNNLYTRGVNNGVKNMQILNKQQLLELEPSLANGITCGLFAKDAYIVSPYLLTICLTEEAIINGGQVLLNTQVVKVVKKTGAYKVVTTFGEYYTKKIVNCAGAGFNSVAKVLGTELIDLKFRRGEYYVLDSTEANLVKHTIFPLPTKNGKGVLITPTIDGNILVGPTSEVSNDSTKTTACGLQDVKQKALSIIKNINLRKTIRTFAGVRAISGDDFVIRPSKTNPDIVYAGGICSPGLSSAPAIAKMVVDMLGYTYNPNVKTKQITPYTLLKDLPSTKQNELIAKDKNYGKIICKCENITAGDILFALKRPLPVVSTDGIKRRVRAGMGRCQGGFCLDGVINLIAKQNQIDLVAVLKENMGSNHIIGNIRGNK